MKRIILALFVAAAMPALAGDPFEERRQVIDRYRKDAPLVIGVFPGTVTADLNNSHNVLRRYLPFSNHLSTEMKRVVSFAPQLNVQEFKKEVAQKRFHAVYVNAEIGVSAVLAGYTPIARREEDIVSVVVVPADASLAALKGLEGKKVGVVDQAMVTTLARGALLDAGVYSGVRLVDAGSSGTEALFNFLDNKTVDAIVVRKESADSALAKAPGKYKIALTAGKAPGFILMAHPEMTSAREREELASALLRLDGKRANDAAVIAGLDGRAGTYVPAKGEDMAEMVKMLEKITTATGARGLIVKPPKPQQVAAAVPPALPALPEKSAGK